jgi:hypothetical protein
LTGTAGRNDQHFANLEVTMPFVTANVRVSGRPVRKAFVEHTGPFGVGSLGWALTDNNGSFTFDAGALANRVDVKVYCQNSVVRVLDGGLVVPIPVSQSFNVGNGDSVTVTGQADHYRILNRCLDVYETVWKQFRPYNRSNRGDFPLGRRASLRETFSDSRRIELSFPDQFPSALAFVEPSGLNNSGYPLAHIKSRSSDGRLFGEADAVSSQHDASLLPHEFGHVFHFSTLAAATRISIEGQYIGFIMSHLSNPFHDVALKTTPFVAFIEAVGIFSERFFAFSTMVEPSLTGVALRRAFFHDELGPQRLASALVDPYVNVGSKDSRGRIQPNLQGNDIEGAVYGAVYLDFASRVGLREAVGLILDSNATSFGEFKQHVEGRGNSSWRDAIRAASTTWGM